MRVIADLHVHSKYARATSPKMNVVELSKYAKIKGIDVLGTGDFLHPEWQKELKNLLSADTEGIYDYDGTKFMLTGEVSLIYTQDGKGRRVHHVIHVPNFDVLAQVTEFFGKKGRLNYDGRPIFGISSVEMTEALMKISKDIEIIPAHAWTPWFAIFGSMSGFNSIEECFKDQTKHIHAIETGMSSDPSMNWRISSLDKMTLVSNSDSHSAYTHRLGREANVFDLKEITYKNILDSIRTRKNFAFTIETSPSYGKYHFDGHRLCNFSCEPQETKKLNKICPKCKRSMTIGVLNRVEELADRPDGFVPKNAVPFRSLLPLTEIISNLLGVGIETKKVNDVFDALIKKFNNEFNILLDVPQEELKKVIDEKLANSIIKNRDGKIKVIPGYDGEYGVPVLSDNGLKKFI
jgi:uncharacterized protein (TIGR00375 family)